MDEFVDQLLVGESVCEIQLPRLTQRKVLEETEGLAPRRSKLGKALGVMQVEGADGSDVEGGDDSADEEGAGGGGRGRYLSRSPSASPSPSPSGDERADRKEGSPEYWTEASEGEEEQDSRRRRRRRKRPVVVEGGGSDDEDAGRYISRSPTPAGSDGRFVSRSPTRSPEPERIQVEHIEGDV